MDNQNQATTGSSGGDSHVKIVTTVMNGIKVPKLGDIVILHMGDNDNIQNNYSKEMPAFIVHVWGNNPPFCVNLKGLPDGTGTIWRTSVLHQQGLGGGSVIAQGPSWRWPDEPLMRGDAPMEASE